MTRLSDGSISLETQTQVEVSRKPIGVFDSGLGGLTVVAELARQMPEENIVYFGDTARVPYGPKSPKTILEMSREDVRFLLTHNIKMIIIACHSASSVAEKILAEEVSVPVVGVVHPGARFAAGLTKTKKVGVIGTRATIQSGSYTRALHALDPDIELFPLATPLFVPFVEEGWLKGPIVRDVVLHYLAPMKAKGVDTLILGCTHYPLLKETIQEILGDSVQLVDSACETVRYVRDFLKAKDWICPEDSGSSGQYRFYVSDDPLKFRDQGRMFLAREIPTVEHVAW